MQAASAVAVAAAFVWLGMVLAISFIETPLKFRAPGVTLQIGLGIGRLVFRALNACELALAAVVVATLRHHAADDWRRGRSGRRRRHPTGAGAGGAAAADPSVRQRACRWGRATVTGALGLRRTGDRQGDRAADRGCVAARDVRRSPDAAGIARPWHRFGCHPRASSTPSRPPPNDLVSRRCGPASMS